MLSAIRSAAIVTLGLTLAVKGEQSILSEHTEGRICDQCIPREYIIAPGIGIDLTSTYATVAIRYHNKSTIDVGRIDGDEEYVAAMKEWSPPWVRHAPPFDNLKDQLRWEIDQARRRLRRARGLPSTPGVGAFGEMIKQLYSMASLRSDVPVLPAVAISMAETPNADKGDFEEAFTLAGVSSVFSSRNSVSGYGPIPQVITALVGKGYLCEHWAVLAACDREESQISQKYLLMISYTNEELVIQVGWAQTANWFSHDIYERYPEYGYNSTSHDEVFWTAVKLRITTILRVSNGRPDMLVLYGESATEKEFQDTLKTALGDSGMMDIYDRHQNSAVDAEMLNARGAAETAKRAQGEPKWCVEGDWCNNRIPGEDGMPEGREL